MKKPTGKWLDEALSKMSEVLEIGSEAADVLVHLQSPTPIGLAAVGLRVLDKVKEKRLKGATQHFKDWDQLDDCELGYQLFCSASKAQKPEPVPGTRRESGIVEHTVNEVEFGWAVRGEHFVGLWAQPREGQNPLEALGAAVWSDIGGNLAVLVSRTTEDGEDGVAIVREDTSKILPSRLGRELVERAQQFISQGHNRSIFLLGAPGTGKSCMMRYMAHLFKGFCLRIRLEDLKTLSARTLVGAVEILRPDVLLIDDLDRFIGGDDPGGSTKASHLLEALEKINQKVKLFIVSANFSEGITDAMLRPGRFDEIETIETIDEEIVEKMLEGCSPAEIKKLIKLPIAYIAEISKRAKVLGIKEAISEVDLLLSRDNDLRWRLASEARKSKRKNSARAPRTDREKVVRYTSRAHYLERRAATYTKQAAAKHVQAEKAKGRADKKDLKKAVEKTSKKKKTPKK